MAGKKILFVAGGIILAIILVLGVGYYLLNSDSIITAQLHLESGNVLVNGQDALDGSILNEGDTIETAANSAATVILYESVLISLEPNTKISLNDLTRDNPQISQEKGETWNKFTKLSGVTAYSISSGNSVASVRGTAFAFKDKKIVTGEGEVDFEVDGEKFLVRENRVVEKLNNKAAERDANNEEKQIISKHNERTIKALKRLRDKQIEKNPKVFGLVKSRLGLDDAQIKRYFEDADEGKINIEEVAKKSPIRLKAIDRVADITKKIQEIKRTRNASLS